MRRWIGNVIALLILTVGVVHWFEGWIPRSSLPSSLPAEDARVEPRDAASDRAVEPSVDLALPQREASVPAASSEPRVSVTGVVVDDLGVGVADASIELLDANGVTLGTSASSDGGAFVVEGPDPDDGSAAVLRGLTIRARKDGHAGCEQRVSDRSRVRLVLARPCSIHGSVFSVPDLVPIAGARIEVRASSFARDVMATTTSDDAGRYELTGLPRGSTTRFGVHICGRPPVHLSVPVGVEPQQRYDVAVPSTPTRTLQVIDAVSRLAVADARITDGAVEFARSDAHGLAELHLAAVPTRLVVDRPGFADLDLALTVADFAAWHGVQVVELNPEIVVRLRLVDPVHEPLREFVVEASFDSTQRELPKSALGLPVVIPVRIGRADADGMVEIRGLNAETPYVLWAGRSESPNDLVHRVGSFVTRGAGEALDLGTLVVDPSLGRISGGVVAGRDSVAGAEVVVERDGAVVARTTSGSGGLISFSGLPPGAYVLTARDASRTGRTNVDVIGGTRASAWIELGASTRSRVAGRVVDREGVPVVGLLLSALVGTETVGSRASDARGEFAIDLSVDPGSSVRLVAQHAFGATPLLDVAAGAMDVELVWTPLPVAALAVRLPSGASQALISIEIREGTISEFRPHPDGGTRPLGADGTLRVRLPTADDAWIRLRRPGVADADAWVRAAAALSRDPRAPSVVELR